MGLELRRVTEVMVNGETTDQTVPEPHDQVKRLLDLAPVTMPEPIRPSGVEVSTKKKLPSSRTRRLQRTTSPPIPSSP